MVAAVVAMAAVPRWVAAEADMPHSAAEADAPHSAVEVAVPRLAVARL